MPRMPVYIFSPPHAMCAMCIFSLVFYGPELHFRAEIIGLHIPEASFLFLGPFKQLRELQLQYTALLISL